ncbi:uncharacterized protein LOC131008058 [Salvia miltiorrhiza]|uniref:uncharacterized protein LOC131008058 n=1 Tax=Salvia miltiorrhiza TaxID=226208 RepID=UPI0025AB6021|nr:uncharacterized protein LOC131008058 [Salvia miltiorrhiza]
MAQLRSNLNNRDKPFWPGEKLNMYTVKSRYKLAMKIRQRNEASTSSEGSVLWNWIWGLDVIPKVKLFMWKCLANAIPTAMALRRRNVDIDPCCRRCGTHEETMEHVLRDCAWSEVLWRVSPLRLQPPNGDCSMMDWNLLIFQQKDISHLDCLAIASRALWSTPLRESLPNQLPLSVDFCRLGQLKASSDAALSVGKGFGIGVVLRDKDDDIKGCRFGFAFSVIEGEAIAMLECLRLCQERGVSDVIFETDSQLLYWLLIKRENDMSYLGDTLRAIHEILISFHRSRRECGC